MDTGSFFAVALNLPHPRRISQVEFKPTEDASMELHIHIAFQRGGKFPCSQDHCGKSFPAYIQCEKHGVKTVQVPWARKGSGFTLLFESWVIEVAKHLPVAVIARMVGEHDTRLWRFIHHYAEKARALEDYSEVTAIGMDETGKKGHNYITVVADLSQRKVIFVTDGKDSTTV